VKKCAGVPRYAMSFASKAADLSLDSVCQIFIGFDNHVLPDFRVTAKMTDHSTAGFVIEAVIEAVIVVVVIVAATEDVAMAVVELLPRPWQRGK